MDVQSFYKDMASVLPDSLTDDQFENALNYLVGNLDKGYARGAFTEAEHKSMLNDLGKIKMERKAKKLWNEITGETKPQTRTPPVEIPIEGENPVGASAPKQQYKSNDYKSPTLEELQRARTKTNGPFVEKGGALAVIDKPATKATGAASKLDDIKGFFGKKLIGNFDVADVASFGGLAALDMMRDKSLLERGISMGLSGAGTALLGPVGGAAGYGAAELINLLIPDKKKEDDLLKAALAYQMQQSNDYGYM